ncbi:MAG: hypothetical protein ABIP75_09325 [Pyrinomonadaceae bacterium]
MTEDAECYFRTLEIRLFETVESARLASLFYLPLDDDSGKKSSLARLHHFSKTLLDAVTTVIEAKKKSAHTALMRDKRRLRQGNGASSNGDSAP